MSCRFQAESQVFGIERWIEVLFCTTSSRGGQANISPGSGWIKWTVRRRQQGREDDLCLEGSVELTCELGLEGWAGFFQKAEKGGGISGRGKSLGKGLEMKCMAWSLPSSGLLTIFLGGSSSLHSYVYRPMSSIVPRAARSLGCCWCRRLSFCSGTGGFNETALEAWGHIWAIDKLIL